MNKRIYVSIVAVLCSIITYGQQLCTSVTWEDICSHPVQLPIIGHIQPKNSDLTKESWWSVGCETMDRDYAYFDKFKQYVPETGVGYARLQSGWAKTEQKKGKYDFAWLDKHVDGLIELGVHPWLCLCYGNNLYTSGGTDLNAKLFDDGPVMDAWLKYVKAVATRYKGKVTMYEVWNEPDHAKASHTFDMYANLFVRTAKVIREIDPDVKIAALGSCSPELPYIRKALAGIKERGGIDNVDYVTYHAYWQHPEAVIPAVKKLRQDVDAISPAIGLLQGETGCPGHLEYGHAMNSITWDEYSQAKWDMRSMLISWSMGCPHSVFTMTDLNYGWMIQSFGLVRANLKGETIYKRPKFYAVQNITSVFGPDIVADCQVTVSSACGHQIMCVGLKKAGKNVGCALWFCDSRPGSSLERENVAVSIKGLGFKAYDSVYVDLLTGNIHSLMPMLRSRGGFGDDSNYYSELPMWDCPVLIMDKTFFDLK